MQDLTPYVRIFVLVIFFFVNACGLPLKRNLSEQERGLLKQLVIERSRTNATLDVNRPPSNVVEGFLEGFFFMLIGGSAYYGIGILLAPYAGIEHAKTAEDTKVLDQFVQALQIILDPAKLQIRLEDEIAKTASANGFTLRVVEPESNHNPLQKLNGKQNSPVLTAEIKSICFGGFMGRDISLKFSINLKIQKDGEQLVDTCYLMDGPVHAYSHQPFSDLLKENLSTLRNETDESLKVLAEDIVKEQFHVQVEEHKNKYTIVHWNWCILECT